MIAVRPIECDVCIIGAGAAGITLAREFTRQPFRVCLLESGGLDPDRGSMELNEGEGVGVPYFPLVSARLRFFGGTTNHWGGHCRPLAPFDLEARDWIPHSGWPLSMSDIAPFYPRAAALCKVSVADWGPAAWEQRGGPKRLPIPGDRFSTVMNLVSPAESRSFGRLYRKEILEAPNITTYLHANATELITDRAGGTVTAVRITTVTGRRLSVAAKLVVLAAGGLENPRLLLVSRRRHSRGVGNEHDLVGRFFMEHPRLRGGILLPSDPRLSMRFYTVRRVGPLSVTGHFSLSPDIMRREQLVGVVVRLQLEYQREYMEAERSKGVVSLQRIVRAMRKRERLGNFQEHLRNVIGDMDGVARWGYFRARYRGEFPLDHVVLSARIDQAPNPDSRVTLSEDKDAVGMNRLRLDWRLSPIDKRSARRALEIFGADVGRAGLGRVQVHLSEDDSDWPAETVGGFHHMGTTRMSDDPKRGVVDRNCRVHGVSNLFIAGSSVFPTAGAGTPTITLVALALRLAQHLRTILR